LLIFSVHVTCFASLQEILRVHDIDGFPCSLMMWCSVLTPAV
jgi:hypothetical protein